RVLGHERQRLAIEPGELHDRADEVPGVEIEGHNMVLPYAVQAPAWTESQPPGPAEPERLPGCEDPHELPGHRIVFTPARHGVRSTERAFAGDHDVPVGSELQVE